MHEQKACMLCLMNIAGMADGCVYDGQHKYTINFVTLVGHDN